MSERCSARPLLFSLVACTLVVAAMWLVRARARVEWYAAFHRWMSEQGVPDGVRNLDSIVMMLMAGAGAWAVVLAMGTRRTTGSFLSDLGMAGGRAWAWRGLGTGVLIGLPMLVLALLFGRGFASESEWGWSSVHGLVVAPMVEEVVYRGVLVIAVWRVAGTGFWTTAVSAGLVFGAGHVTWTVDGWSSGWTNALPTGAGGVWFAWLARRWGEHWGGALRANIWVPMSLHAMMNLAWLVMAADYGAVGTVWPNLARGATIAFGVIWTLRATTGQDPAAEPQGTPGCASKEGDAR
ncbi:MAG: CPBP family intramembrane metalloprotease [Phycisphaerales bacterium]|nr:CPBP family intramembrane metalloprotease [Phycisphaerales bacterium]